MRRLGLVCLLLVPTQLAHGPSAESCRIGVQPLFGVGYLTDRNWLRRAAATRTCKMGLTDAVSIIAFGGSSYHPLPAKCGKEAGWKGLAAGVASQRRASRMRIDIVRIQPFFEAAVGVLSLQSQIGKEAKVVDCKPAMSVGLGADYLLNRRFSFGVAFRYHGIVTDLANIPLYLTVGPRAQVRFWL
jgi:hypothetical protein